MKIYAMLVFCVFFWAGNFILGRYIKDELAPIELAFFRWFGVLIIFLPYIIKMRLEIIKVLKEHLFLMLIFSFLSVAFFNTSLYVGLRDTTATNALLINSSTPIFIIIFSFFILRVKISKFQILGVIISMLGVIYLAVNGDFEKLFGLNFNKGDIWVIASSLSWALYSVILKFKPKDFVGFFPTNVLLGTIMLFVVFYTQGYELSNISKLSLRAHLVVAYIVIFASIISFFLWHEAIREIGAGKAGQFAHLMPVFGIILAYIFLNESLHSYQILGFLLVGFGLFLSLSKRIQR